MGTGEMEQWFKSTDYSSEDPGFISACTCQFTTVCSSTRSDAFSGFHGTWHICGMQTYMHSGKIPIHLKFRIEIIHKNFRSLLL